MTFTLAHIEQLKRDGKIRGHFDSVKLRSGKIKKYDFYFGIDPGTLTGVAMWDKNRQEFCFIETTKIHNAINGIRKWHEHVSPIFIRIEDARKRTWIPKMPTEKRERGRNQGAGSIMRDCKIWQDFLTDLGIDFEMVAPKNNKTKMTADAFRKLTKWEGRTDQHNRDASMLVFGI